MAHDSIALTTFSKAFEQAGDYVLRFVVNPSRKHEANFSNNSAQILVKSNKTILHQQCLCK
jgi:hypothetical protein